MFGFVKTEEKTKLDYNNDLLLDRKRKEKLFTIAFSIIAFLILNLALYLMTNSL
ncbi:MAG: hypothetical protein MUF28_00025 [Ignavibacterium sp.]|jgi:hypothetical protein|nr:hypothetical protein [Ignavibacterium sp.]